MTKSWNHYTFSLPAGNTFCSSGPGQRETAEKCRYLLLLSHLWTPPSQLRLGGNTQPARATSPPEQEELGLAQPSFELNSHLCLISSIHSMHSLHHHQSSTQHIPSADSCWRMGWKRCGAVLSCSQRAQRCLKPWWGCAPSTKYMRQVVYHNQASTGHPTGSKKSCLYR